MCKILLITPPLTQLNTPYPATMQLLGFLRSKHIEAQQADLSIELIEALFTKANITAIFEHVARLKLSKQHRIISQQADFYIRTIEPVMQFLSGRDHSLATRFSNRAFWPVTKRLPADEDLEWAFGTLGNYDRATHLCTLFLKDLCDLIQKNIDSHFELIRYAESLCMYLSDFEPLQKELEKPLTFIDTLLLAIFEKKIETYHPEFVGFTVPFPGNLYSAMRCAQWLKANHPSIKTIMGGGYVNTELRQLNDTGIFNFIDYLVFDDGELPLFRLLTGGALVRTLYCDTEKNIVREQFDSAVNFKFSDIGTPDYDGLLTNNYLNLIELTNPMHALWSNGRWNKMTLAHGCYWAKCVFCDGTLDYIRRFEKAPVEMLVDRMEILMQQTGISGFHFVDEAAPPVILRKLAEEILKRKLTVTYWTNIRFEKSFTAELCYLLAQSGCIAVSGGLEVASPRILELINKGITIETARECMKNLSDNGIMTHAYLMYGFPTQTARETIESLEVVRSLFASNYLHSAFWHRYAMTIHSPSGQTPEIVGARAEQSTYNSFANNEIPFSTPNPIDLDFYGEALRKACFNYMQGAGLDLDVKTWFTK
ncbi:MAG: radical SAM protein [Porphyromonadaceae bacterium CG2_30_38_12]|nr:MAG: radical SAM protein [Porphyromonadaceae bacterium CG2_30_38_12]